MKKMHYGGRFLAGTLAAALSVTSLSFPILVEAEEIISYKAGTYTGTGIGRNGDVSIVVTLKDGKVEKVEEGE